MEVNDQQDIENRKFDVIDFKVLKKKTGKVSHQYTIIDQPFLCHKVQKSGKSYFKCTESGCKATLHANQNNMYCNLFISMFECNDFK